MALSFSVQLDNKKRMESLLNAQGSPPSSKYADPFSEFLFTSANYASLLHPY